MNQILSGMPQCKGHLTTSSTVTVLEITGMTTSNDIVLNYEKLTQVIAGFFSGYDYKIVVTLPHAKTWSPVKVSVTLLKTEFLVALKYIKKCVAQIMNELDTQFDRSYVIFTDTDIIIKTSTETINPQCSGCHEKKYPI